MSSSSSLSSYSSSSFFATTSLEKSSDKNPKRSTLILPSSLMIEIFLYLAEKEMLISARICKQWGEVQTHHILRKELISRYAFGKRQWTTYFGDIGEEPPLSFNIDTILSSPCPIWSGKQVRDTHLLVLVPATVNGKKLTLQSLGELVKSPKEGHKTQYGAWYPGGNENSSLEKNTWVLVTRDVLPRSRNQPYDKQVALVGELTKKANVSYAVPCVIELVASLFMHYVRSGERLYSDNPWTYTRCQEKYDTQWPMTIGGFSASGVSIECYNDDYEYNGVGAMRGVS